MDWRGLPIVPGTGRSSLAARDIALQASLRRMAMQNQASGADRTHYLGQFFQPAPGPTPSPLDIVRSSAGPTGPPVRRAAGAPGPQAAPAGGQRAVVRTVGQPESWHPPMSPPDEIGPAKEPSFEEWMARQGQKGSKYDEALERLFSSLSEKTDSPPMPQRPSTTRPKWQGIAEAALLAYNTVAGNRGAVDAYQQLKEGQSAQAEQAYRDSLGQWEAGIEERDRERSRLLQELGIVGNLENREEMRDTKLRSEYEEWLDDQEVQLPEGFAKMFGVTTAKRGDVREFAKEFASNNARIYGERLSHGLGMARISAQGKADQAKEDKTFEHQIMKDAMEAAEEARKNTVNALIDQEVENRMKKLVFLQGGMATDNSGNVMGDETLKLVRNRVKSAVIGSPQIMNQINEKAKSAYQVELERYGLGGGDDGSLGAIGRDLFQGP